MTIVVFMDTETTSLRPDRRAWEIGLIIRDDDGDDTDYRWFVDIDDLDLGNADLMSLKIGGFYDRHPQAMPIQEFTFTKKREADEYGVYSEQRVLRDLESTFLRGATIVGAVPNFDTEVLSARMRANGILPSWHYHLVDVETLAAGALRQPPPWGFDDLLTAYGLKYDEADRHTALGDARMVRDLYDAVLKGPPSDG